MLAVLVAGVQVLLHQPLGAGELSGWAGREGFGGVRAVVAWI